MAESYDVLIIGAGIGGMTAAARLLEEGLRVLVVESDPHPGGTAYAYHRRGFDFPMGPLGFSSPELVKDILVRVGIVKPLEYERVHYELRAFGLRAPLSLPYGEMITALAKLFPDEEAAISRFFGHMNEISSVQGRLAEEGMSHSRKGESISAARYLDSLIGDWRLRRILGSMGSREPYSSITLLAAMWSLLCARGIHYPAGGMRGLCDLLAEGLGWEAPSRGAGIDIATTLYNPEGPGSLMLRTQVAEIMVRDGKAMGALLSDGTRREADAVISNADFKATFTRLCPRDAVPDELYRAVSAAPQTASNLQICLGLDAQRVDLSAFTGASRIIYRRHGGGPPDGAGPDWDAPQIDPHALAGEELEATLLSADDPLLAPEGGAVLVIRVAVPHRHFARFRPQPRQRHHGYFAYKTSLAHALVAEVSGFVPGLPEAVAYMDVATPLTFEERGGRSGGAVAGWSWDYLEGSQEQAVELIRTPIAGLYMAGYQAFSMLALGGVPSAMKSGLKAAEYLLAGAGPVGSMHIPGSTRD
ncbi:MAG: NAD(P)/FAD-dependent oxidoreductase [Actinobacteria bacterium]|nr:NAD(P)/FAD-dependent oxidoreductase [Actinomycetota bacterium]